MSELCLLDTNLLLLHLVGSAAKDAVRRVRRIRDFTQQQRRWVAEFVSQFGGLVVVPQILAEVSNLLPINRTGAVSGEILRIYSALAATIEIFVPKDRYLSAAWCPRLGVTDSAIIAAAQERGFVVATVDFELSGRLLKLGCRAVNMIHNAPGSMRR